MGECFFIRTFSVQKVTWVMYVNDCHRLKAQIKDIPKKKKKKCVKDANLRLGLLLHDKEVEQLSKVKTNFFHSG